MNIAEAQETITGLLGCDIEFTPEQLARMLDASLTYDAEGRLPGMPGYEATHDGYWLAAKAAELLAIRDAAQGGIASFTSEGATFTMKDTDWLAVAVSLRKLSPLARIREAGMGRDQTITVDGAIGYDPRSQSWPHNTSSSVIGNWS